MPGLYNFPFLAYLKHPLITELLDLKEFYKSIWYIYVLKDYHNISVYKYIHGNPIQLLQSRDYNRVINRNQLLIRVQVDCRASPFKILEDIVEIENVCVALVRDTELYEYHIINW